MTATGVPGPTSSPRRAGEHLHDTATPARAARRSRAACSPRRNRLARRRAAPATPRRHRAPRAPPAPRLGALHIGFRGAQRLVRGVDHLLLHVQRGRRPLELLRRQPAARRQLRRATLVGALARELRLLPRRLGARHGQPRARRGRRRSPPRRRSAVRSATPGRAGRAGSRRRRRRPPPARRARRGRASRSAAPPSLRSPPRPRASRAAPARSG